MPRVLIAAALAFLTTTAAAQEVSYDFDKSANREIDVKASPEKREKNIDQAAEKLFKHYPPAT